MSKNNQDSNTKKSIMAYAIENLSDQEFNEFIKNLNKYNLINKGVISDENYNFFSSFGYAIKLGQFSKAEEILNLVDTIDNGGTFKNEDGKWISVLAYLMENGNIQILKKYKNKINLNIGVYYEYGIEYTGYDYIDKLNNPELTNALHPNLNIIKKSLKGEECVFEEINNLTSDEVFIMFKDDSNPDNKKSVMTCAIEKLSDDDFKEFIKKLDKEKLETKAILSDGNSMYFDSFGYSIRSGQFSKAKEILKLIDNVGNGGFYKIENNKVYTVISYLLESGHVDIVAQYKDKFDFNKPIYVEGNNVYNTLDYVTKILKNDEIKTRLGL